MATKRIELEMLEAGQGCLAKADDGEPVFILRAQDRLFPTLVQSWCDLASALGAPDEKIDEARRLAELGRDWQATNGCKVPD